jgi:hypothetical protein
MDLTRRQFLKTASAFASAAVTPAWAGACTQSPTDPTGATIRVLNPQMRVPLSFIIDDSTCLVNLGHFCMPQFAEAWPDRASYKKPWKTWPREIPDAFLREFGEWCAGQGVKGKFSVVPYPACVGWLDRELPGWSRRELRDSLRLVRELMVPHWDIHPEMITHTRVIDLKTGRPMAEINAGTMENSYPQTKKSVDELAAYIAYALRVLQNCELPCEGITTPGGFGNLEKPELSLAVQQAVRAVYGCELPHYFKYVKGGNESTEPILEHISGRDTPDVRVCVNVPAGTGDWFGGWDGDEVSHGERYASDDGSSGRMVELIERGQPALMLCHWPGLYTHGTKRGFADFQKVVRALEGRYRDRILWMKLSEIARYWAAKGLTRIGTGRGAITLDAPFAAPRFTVQITAPQTAVPRLAANRKPLPLTEVTTPRDLKPDTWLRDKQAVVVCFDLPKGQTEITL